MHSEAMQSLDPLQSVLEVQLSPLRPVLPTGAEVGFSVSVSVAVTVGEGLVEGVGDVSEDVSDEESNPGSDDVLDDGCGKGLEEMAGDSLGDISGSGVEEGLVEGSEGRPKLGDAEGSDVPEPQLPPSTGVAVDGTDAQDRQIFLADACTHRSPSSHAEDNVQGVLEVFRQKHLEELEEQSPVWSKQALIPLQSIVVLHESPLSPLPVPQVPSSTV